MFRSLSLFACLALAACAASTGWVNPELPAVRQSTDLTACRRMADRDLGAGAISDPGPDRSGDPMKMVDRMETGRQYDSLVAECMTDRGYHRVP